MRVKVGENVGEGSSSIAEDVSVYDERKKIVIVISLKWVLKLLKRKEYFPTL